MYREVAVTKEAFRKEVFKQRSCTWADRRNKDRVERYRYRSKQKGELSADEKVRGRESRLKSQTPEMNIPQLCVLSRKKARRMMVHPALQQYRLAKC